MSTSETGFVCPDCRRWFIAGSDYVERYGKKFCTPACAGLNEPDPQAELRDKLRALAEDWRNRAEGEALRMEKSGPSGGMASAILAGQNIGRIHCAIEIEHLIEGAK